MDLSSLQLHPHPMIVCDEDATLELRVKTVKVSRPPQVLWVSPASADMLPIQYFKSIEEVARTQGFEQILPSRMRTGPGPIPRTVVDEVQSPTILAPQPTTSRMLRASPATEYPVRSVSPDLVPDRMADRITSVDRTFAGRLTPNPEQRTLLPNAANAIGAY